MLFSLKHSVFLEILRDFLLVMIGFMISATIGGFIKAFVALLVNDSTPKNDGFLSFNPLNHCDLTQTAPIAAIFLIISRIIESPTLSQVLIIFAIAFLKTSIFDMYFDNKAPRADVKIAIINLAGIITSAFLLTQPLIFLAKLSLTYKLQGPWLLIVRDIISYISTFAFINLIINLPPIPPREAFYVIRPFLSYKAERFLERLRENIFIYMMVCFVCATLLLPAVTQFFDFCFGFILLILKTPLNFAANFITSITNFLK